MVTVEHPLERPRMRRHNGSATVLDSIFILVR
jgi:hypothetical protein